MMTLRVLGASVILAYAAAAQAPPQPLGDYTGSLGPLHLVVHLQADASGKLNATLDSPDQGANGILADPPTLTPGYLTVFFPSLHATFAAEESADGKVLSGTWTQGAPAPLVLRQRPPFVPARAPSPIDGDWKGTLGTPPADLALLLHIRSDLSGVEYLTFDSPAQNAFGLIAGNVTFADRRLTFDLPAVHGHYAGLLAPGEAALSGTWTQGSSLPLDFTRVVPFVPAAKPSPADGEWTGTVATPQGTLRALLHVKSDRAGNEYVSFDSPDQAASGFDATHAALRGSRLSFDLPELHGSFTGTVAPDALDGMWTQSSAQPIAMPVHLTRPTLAPDHPATQPLPVPFAAMPARLDAELKPLIENPALAGAHDIGVAIGFFDHGQRRILTYGTATPASVFEIGSLTKTFTGLLLAQAVTRGAVSLDTPVRTLLPHNMVAKPDGPEITLLSLATHHSGLPRLPENLHPANPRNPYADYTLADLDAFIAAHGTALPPNAPYLYSNVGAALLGQALASQANLSYAALLERDILTPLHLSHTSLSASQNVLPGHTEDDAPTPAWDLNAIAPAGGLHSDVDDLLTYAEAQLHPPAALAEAIALQHILRADTSTGRIALVWQCDPATGDFWHDGATGGFAAFAFFNPDHDLAGVVLVNRSSALATSLGRQISALLDGREADPLRR